MKKILVIGYGNTIRGDDAAGIRAAELLSEKHPDFKYILMHQLMPEMAEDISKSDIVFFIDADSSAKNVTSRLIEPSADFEQPRTHFLSPGSLLSISLKLYQSVPSKAYVIGIPASSFEISEELSDNTLRGIDESIKEVEKLIEN